MTTSDWKLRSNRRNAEKSTGPTTDTGKERSRANAWKHGLSGEGAIAGPTEIEAIALRLDEWRPGYRIDSPTKEWAFEQMVVNSFRIDACQRQQRAVSAYDAARAEKVWDIDHEADAAVLGGRIGRKPETVAKQLHQSKHGCEWLMEQWCHLGLAADASGWSDERVERALDLAGVPLDARDDAAGIDPATFAENAYLRLERLVTSGYDQLDDCERATAVAGCPIILSKRLALLQRYETACLKRYLDARSQLEPATIDAPEALANEERIDAAPAPVPEPHDDLEADDAEPAPVPTLPTPARPRDAVPVSATANGRPMNRKQRREQAKQTAKAK